MSQSPLAQAIAFQNANTPAQTGIAPTDVVGAYKLASDAAEKNYAAKLAASNAMFGGLAGLGGAGITAFGPKIASNYFGQGAATAAAPSVSTAMGLGDAATAAAPSVAADLGSVAAPTVAADLSAAAPAAAAAGTDFLASMPEWLTALLALA